MKNYDHLSIFLQGAENCAPGKWNTNKNALCIFDENGNRVIWTNHQNITAFIIAAHDALPVLKEELADLRQQIQQIEKVSDQRYDENVRLCEKLDRIRKFAEEAYGTTKAFSLMEDVKKELSDD